jgi:hypothetical protein
MSLLILPQETEHDRAILSANHQILGFHDAECQNGGPNE